MKPGGSSKGMHQIAIAFGSNLGNRRANILKACFLLSRKIRISGISSFYRNMPRENVRGGYFLNGALVGTTDLSPQQLLNFTKSVEEMLGRPRTHRPLNPRTIDIDIIFYDDAIIKKKGLQIPHPKVASRDFVLKGLAELIPLRRHPVLGKTVAELFRELKNENHPHKKRTCRTS
jgi:2-amino-4-hydroxy-6-hydroxymethyldihydropteridine diphosphokinase